MGLRRAGTHLMVAAKREVSIANPGRRKKRRRSTSQGKKGSSYTVYDSPSRPGQAPRVQTGFGRSGIVHEHDHKELVSRVGVRDNAEYMVILEIKKDRPWLGMRGALGKQLAVIRRLAAIGGRSQIP